MVPTSESCGRSGGFGACTGTATTTAAGATAVGGGRREAEKIGRSRVADSCLRGIPHNGLAFGCCPACATSGCCAGEGCGPSAAAAPISDVSRPAGLATPNAATVATSQKQPTTQILLMLLIAD